MQKDLSLQIQEAASLCAAGDKSLALNKVENSVQLWDKYNKKLSHVCNNNDLKEISNLISQLEFLLESDSKAFDITCIEIKNRLLLLLEEEIPDFDGIF